MIHYTSSATFSYKSGDVKKEHYTEGIYVGYRYFDTFNIPVRYGFGYGLSYTTFDVANYDVKKTVKNTITVTADIKNTGNMAGREVFEVYVSLPQHTLKKEARRLAGFAKTKLLDAGETEKVIVEIPLTYLTSFDEKESSYVLESGDYIIWAGNSLAGAQAIAKAELDESVCMEKVKVICPLKESREEDLNDKNRPEITVKQDISCIKLNAADIHTRKVLYRDNCDIYEKEAMDFVNTLSVDELIQLSSGDPGKAQGGNLGAAGCMLAGNDLVMPGCFGDRENLKKELSDGTLDIKDLKVCIARLANICFKSNQYE